MTSLESVLSGFLLKHDEDSVKFKTELRKQNLEREIEAFKFNSNSLINHIPDLSGTTPKLCYYFIDKHIYSDVLTILKREGLENCINEICSILKASYYKTLLAEVNKDSIVSKNIFYKEFGTLLKCLRSPITTIKFQTNKKGEEYKIKSLELISLILKGLKESIFKDPIAASILVDVESNSDVFNNLSSSIVDDAIFSIILQIKKKARPLGNKERLKPITAEKLSNNLCEIIFEIISHSMLIDVDKIQSPPKDFIRIRFKRYIIKHNNLLRLFDKKKYSDPLDFDNLFPDSPHLQKIIDTKNLITRL